MIWSLHASNVGGVSEGSLGPARQYKLSLRGWCSDVSPAVFKLVKEALRATGSGNGRHWVLHGFRVNRSGQGFLVSFSSPRVECKEGGTGKAQRQLLLSSLQIRKLRP